MHALEKILGFEQEADNQIAEAKKKASQILQTQEQEILKITKDTESKLTREKESLAGALKTKREEIEKKENTRKDNALRTVREEFKKHLNQAIKMVKDAVLEAP